MQFLFEFTSLFVCVFFINQNTRNTNRPDVVFFFNFWNVIKYLYLQLYENQAKNHFSFQIRACFKT